jgi:hypothetical protein
MSKTVVQQLVDADERIKALETELKTAKDETTKARVSAALATAKTATTTTTTGAMTPAQAQAEYAKLPPEEKKAYRVKNWRLLGISEEK